jgi:serine/threonine-protein kinase RsbW
MSFEAARTAQDESAARRDRLVLAGYPAELERLARWLRQWTYENALPADLSFAVSVCVEQAVSDVVMACDAAGGSESAAVEIVVEIERNAVTLVAQVEDNGRPLALGTGQAKVSSLDRARMGDLGLRLMRSLASGIEYERRGDRNRLTLRFLQPEPSSMMTG